MMMIIFLEIASGWCRISNRNSVIHRNTEFGHPVVICIWVMLTTDTCTERERERYTHTYIDEQPEKSPVAWSFPFIWNSLKYELRSLKTTLPMDGTTHPGLGSPCRQLFLIPQPNSTHLIVENNLQCKVFHLDVLSFK